MSRIEIPGNNNILTCGMQPVTQSQQVGVKVQLIVQALLAALAIREVNVEQTEIWMERGNEPPFHIEEKRIHAKLEFPARCTQKSRHSTVSQLFRQDSRLPRSRENGSGLP